MSRSIKCLLTSLACAATLASLTGCATSQLAEVAELMPVRETRGQQTPYPARPAPRLAVEDQPLARAALEGRDTPAQAGTKPSAPPADGSPRVVSTSPLWIERVVGDTTLLQRISERDLTVVSELSLPGVGESAVEGQRFVQIAKERSGQQVRAVSLRLGFVVEEWQLGNAPASLKGFELATGEIHIQRAGRDLVFTPGSPSPLTPVRLSRANIAELGDR